MKTKFSGFVNKLVCQLSFRHFSLFLLQWIGYWEISSDFFNWIFEIFNLSGSQKMW